MIEKLIDRIEAKDYLGVASLFANDRNTEYVDYCPACVGLDNFFVYGQRAIEMFFRDRFYNNTFSMAEVRIEDENSATFFGCYNGRYYYCRMRIEAVTDDGKIKKAVVRPE